MCTSDQHKTVVSLKDVTFAYAESENGASIKNIDLDIAEGECVLLCGMSGCGKTTVTRLINGLIPHFYEGTLSGSVHVGDLDIPHIELYETAGVVGSVFQNPRSQFFTVDVTSEIAFGCENIGLPKETVLDRVDKAARELNVQKLLGRDLFELSGGEKQKVACASVSALEPKVLVLDEPSSNLDMTAIADLSDQIARWKSQGKTVVVAEHRLFYLKGLVDRVIYLRDGRIVDEMTWEELESFSDNERAALGLRVPDLTMLSRQIEQKYAQSGDRIHRNRNLRLDTSISAKGQVSLLGLSFSRDGGATKILDLQSLTLPRGKATAIIGPNGAGKTTFARCLCGIQRGARGVMWIDGTSYRRRARLKKCFQVMQDVNHQLFTESVEDEVLLSMDEPDEQQADAILDSLGLLELKDLHPLSLSGGQKQRCAIASALAARREVIIFDEPTSGLDRAHMQRVAENIQQLEEQGKTVLIITHDPEFILACCSYVAHIEGGSLAESYALDHEGYRRMLAFFMVKEKRAEINAMDQKHSPLSRPL